MANAKIFVVLLLQCFAIGHSRLRRHTNRHESVVVGSTGHDAVPFLNHGNLTLESAAAAWFRIPKKSVTSDMLDGYLNDHYMQCSPVQIIDNKVYVMSHYKIDLHQGRAHDVAWLLHEALKSQKLPDVEMVMCPGDAGDEIFPHGKIHNEGVPFLMPTSSQTNLAAVPVPMLARNGTDIWGHDFVHRLVAGEEVWPRIPWQQRNATAFFRGDTHNNYCQMERGDVPERLSHCFRIHLLKALQNDASFDVAASNEKGSWVPEDKWEQFKYQLIVGNMNGWADRMMASLFKGSAVIFADQGSYEWYMPLLVQGEDYISADPTPESISEKVAWAQNHDAETQRIVQNANKKARELFNLKSVSQYMALVAKSYAERLTYVPTLRPHMSEYTGSKSQ